MESVLDIDDLGNGGDGIARLPDGRTVFVPLTVPGDRALCRVDADGKGFLRGHVLSLERAGPSRATAPCRHFGLCGGCALQHLDVTAYRALKTRQVTGALDRAGIICEVEPETIFIPHATRRRANFAAIAGKNGTVIGFHERKSATIRNVPDCLLITEDVRAVMEGFRPFVAAIAGHGRKIDILIQCADDAREIALTGHIAPGWEAQQALSDALRVLDLSRISIRSRDYEQYEILLEAKGFYKRFDSLVVNLAPGAFLQPSAEGERALSDCVIRGAGDARRIADLFCGNGTFTGPMLGRDCDVLAVDSAEDAIATLRSAGVQARVRNLFKDPLSAEEMKDRDCVILDPPRAGAQMQVEQIAWSVVPRAVYVSCNPQSFASDAAILIREGGFKLSALTIVDQFIWSPHTEVVGVFER